MKLKVINFFLVSYLFLYQHQICAEISQDLVQSPATSSNQLPDCIDRKRIDPSLSNESRYESLLTDSTSKEMLARLIYSETVAAKCPEENQQVMSTITQVLLNRIDKKNGDINAVIYEPNQFPISIEKNSENFLCPKDINLWNSIVSQIDLQMRKDKRKLHADTIFYHLYKSSPQISNKKWLQGLQNEDRSTLDEKGRSCIRAFKTNKNIRN